MTVQEGPAPAHGAPGYDLAATQAEADCHGGTVVTWRTRCDNRDPSRVTDSGYAVRYDRKNTPGQPGFRFWPGPNVRDAGESIFIVDDGITVVPHYVAGWSDKRGELILYPFPTNPDGQTRADRPGGVIDYSMWALGPTRCYHLKISTALV